MASVMQGDAYSIPVTIKSGNGTLITPEIAACVEITVGQFAKRWPGQVTFDEKTGEWKFPMTQNQTFRFTPGAAVVQARVVFQDGSIMGGSGAPMRVEQSASRGTLPQPEKTETTTGSTPKATEVTIPTVHDINVSLHSQVILSDPIKAPYIGDNGNWYEYDAATGEFVDTGKAASTPPINTDTAGKHLVNDGEKAQWQDMSPLIVNVTKNGQDASGNPIYKSDKTFDEIKAAYDIGREIKLGEIGDFDSSTFQYYCGSEPKLIDISDTSVGFLGTGNTTAYLNNALNLVSQYSGLPSLFTSIVISKTEKGDDVAVESSFTIDNEKGQIVFEPDAITKLSPISANLIPVTRTENGLECGIADETVFLMVLGWLTGINDPTKPIPYSPTQVLLLGLKDSLGGVYDLCNVYLNDPDDGSGSTVAASFVRTTGVGISLVEMVYYSNKAHWYYYDYPVNFSLLKTDTTDNGKILRVVGGEWQKVKLDGSDLSFGINNANVNDFLRVASVTDGVPTSWKVDTIANAKGVNF